MRLRIAGGGGLPKYSPRIRCSIAHGLGSKLIDVGQPVEHEKIVNMVHSWTRAVVYDFISSNQNPIVTIHSDDIENILKMIASLRLPSPLSLFR